MKSRLFAVLILTLSSLSALALTGNAGTKSGAGDCPGCCPGCCQQGSSCCPADTAK
jgi:hypothetical protein